MIGSAAALVALFTHTFPSVPVQAPNITTTCTNLQVLGPSNLFSGITAYMVGKCAPFPNVAITVQAAGPATPSFTLPTGAKELAIFSDIGSATVCGPTTSFGYALLTTGTPFSFPAGGTFSYCITYNPPAGATSVDSFTVTWGQ